jgi:hypothetical protein
MRPENANVALQQKGTVMAKRVGLKSGKTSVKRGVQKPSKSAATNSPKAAATKLDETPPTPSAIVATPPEPVVETPVPKQPVGSAPRKPKAKTTPTRLKTASAPASVIAAASPETAAPLPVLEVETAPAPSPTIEADAKVATDPAPVPTPLIEVEPVPEATAEARPEPAPPADPAADVEPMPELTAVCTAAEADGPSGPASDEFQPVEEPSLEVEQEIAASEQPELAAAGYEERSTTALLESLVYPLTTPYSTFLNAIVESSNAATTGIEALSEEITEYGWRQFDEVFAAWKRVLQTSSPAELFQSQCDYARDVLDDFLDQSTKVTFATIRLANEVAEPLARPPQTH